MRSHYWARLQQWRFPSTAGSSSTRRQFAPGEKVPHRRHHRHADRAKLTSIELSVGRADDRPAITQTMMIIISTDDKEKRKKKLVDKNVEPAW